MLTYALSLAVGLAVGALYALIGVQSPAPPLVALAGLLGMVIGEQAVLRLRAPPTAPPATSAAMSVSHDAEVCVLTVVDQKLTVAQSPHQSMLCPPAVRR